MLTFNLFHVITAKKTLNFFVTRSEIYPFVLCMECGWMIFIKNFKFWKKNKIFHFVLFHWISWFDYSSINLKRHSEPSGLRPGTSSLVWFEFEKTKIIIDLRSVVLSGQHGNRLNWHFTPQKLIVLDDFSWFWNAGFF